VCSNISVPPDVIVRVHELDTVTGGMARNVCEALIDDVHQLMGCMVIAKVFH
jgi:hypothetical protein